MARRFREVTDQETGITFRFLYNRGNPSRLHVEARWQVTPETAIEAFARGIEHTVWLEGKRCFETVSDSHVVVWLWMDEAHTRVLVITCVPLEQSHYS